MSLLEARLALLLTRAEGEEERSISCADCDAETSTVEDLETHVAADHLLWVRFQCALCPRVKFPSRKNGVDHFALKHPSTSVQLTENIDFAKEKELIDSLCRAFRQRKGETDAVASTRHGRSGTSKKDGKEEGVGSSETAAHGGDTIQIVSDENRRSTQTRSSLGTKKRLADEADQAEGAEEAEEDDDVGSDTEDKSPVESKKMRPSAPPLTAHTLLACRICGRNVIFNHRKHVLSHLDVDLHHYHCSVCNHNGPTWEHIRSHIRSSHPHAPHAKPVANHIGDAEVVHKQWLACFGAVPLRYG